MELFEYIKSQLPQVPNSTIMKQLGTSDELIEYVKETLEKFGQLKMNFRPKQ